MSYVYVPDAFGSAGVTFMFAQKVKRKRTKRFIAFQNYRILGLYNFVYAQTNYIIIK